MTYARDYYIDPGVWKARHREMCEYFTSVIDSGQLVGLSDPNRPLCATLNVHTDDWSQLAYAKMRSLLSEHFHVTYRTVRERQMAVSDLDPYPDLFCVHLQDKDPRKILKC